MELYNVHRPVALEDVVGNRSTIKSLKSVLKRELDQIPHAFLFTGPSGCGKTTLARITAKMLGCSDWDYNEIDSADFGGVDMIRELRQNMSLAPSKGKTRVWLIDECHELSKKAQDALLKALEDAPKHVYILLATTDPDDLKKTLKTRCSTFEVAPLNDKEMKWLVGSISEREEIVFPEEVVEQIIVSAQGSARKALVLVDQIIDLEESEMLEAAQQSEAFKSEIRDLCQALMKRKKWKEVSNILKGLKGEQSETIRRAVLGYCGAVLLNNGDPRLYCVLDSFSDNTFATGFPGIIKAAFEVTLED